MTNSTPDIHYCYTDKHKNYVNNYDMMITLASVTGVVGGGAALLNLVLNKGKTTHENDNKWYLKISTILTGMFLGSALGSIAPPAKLETKFRHVTEKGKDLFVNERKSDSDTKFMELNNVSTLNMISGVVIGGIAGYYLGDKICDGVDWALSGVDLELSENTSININPLASKAELIAKF